jgi:hypothetical protein
VIVLDYPKLFNGEDCNPLTWFSPSEETRLNETAVMLKNVISAAATRAGSNFIFRDVIPSSAMRSATAAVARRRSGSAASPARRAKATTRRSQAKRMVTTPSCTV